MAGGDGILPLPLTMPVKPSKAMHRVAIVTANKIVSVDENASGVAPSVEPEPHRRLPFHARVAAMLHVAAMYASTPATK